MASEEIVEIDSEAESLDPDATPPSSRDVVTQPYDLVVISLIEQIKSGDIILRPSFQRGYVWSNPMASKLVESIILNVPIPPCFLSQNDDFKLDVVDGHQRLGSINRFIDNQFSLSSLTIKSELNNKRFHQLPGRVQRQIKTHVIRCVAISNKSDPDMKFDIFERLNTNTSSLNAQELRNCLFRGNLNDFLKEVSKKDNWLNILGRKFPDKRMRGEEIILRYFAFQQLGLENYRTPLKNWLNEAAKWGQNLPEDEIHRLDEKWEQMIAVSTVWFDPRECFRRPESKAINKALFDLIAQTASNVHPDKAIEYKDKFRRVFYKLLENEEFADLISRAVDHKKRTTRRFQIWNQHFDWME